MRGGVRGFRFPSLSGTVDGCKGLAESRTETVRNRRRGHGRMEVFYN